jgi:hypothetical protein
MGSQLLAKTALIKGSHLWVGFHLIFRTSMLIVSLAGLSFSG